MNKYTITFKNGSTYELTADKYLSGECSDIPKGFIAFADSVLKKDGYTRYNGFLIWKTKEEYEYSYKTHLAKVLFSLDDITSIEIEYNVDKKTPSEAGDN